MDGLSVIIDSGSGLPKKWYQQNGLVVVQHALNFPDGSSETDFNVDAAAFYNNLRAPENTVPTTNSPNVAQFTEAYDASFHAGASRIVVVTPVKSVNSVFNSAALSAKEHPRSIDITVADTHTVGPAQALIGAEIKKTGEYDLIGEIEKLSSQSRVYVASDGVKFLASSGRVASVKRFAGSVLGVKPVISIVPVSGAAGEYAPEVVLNSRTMNRSVEFIVSKFAEDAREFTGRGFTLVDLVVVHSGNDAVANSLREKLIEVLWVNLPNVEVKYSGLMSPVLGRQFGPGAVGVAALYL